MANATDFSDPVTVLYGHNIVNDAMFATLHAYEDPAFFADNPELYVYLPDRILAYEVVAAYEYDDRHILNSFDFSDPAVRTGYFASVLAPDDPKANVRDGAQLDADDRIVQLSTWPLGPDQQPGALYRHGRAPWARSLLRELRPRLSQQAEPLRRRGRTACLHALA